MVKEYKEDAHMYKPNILPATGVATIGILGFRLESSVLYVLLGISLILIGFRSIRLLYKEKINKKNPL